jgi:hypothetical protein
MLSVSVVRTRSISTLASASRSPVTFGQPGIAAGRLVISGMSNRDVAETLVVSPKMVTDHLGHVFAKLGVKSRAQLVASHCSTTRSMRHRPFLEQRSDGLSPRSNTHGGDRLIDRVRS